MKRGGGAEKVLTMPKRGHKTFWGSFYAVTLAILKGGHNKFYLVLREGGGSQKVSDLRFSHFVAPPPPHN